MSPHPLIILSSARKQSDTKKLADIIFSGIEADRIDLLDYKVNPYNYEGNYSSDDTFPHLMDIVLEHQKIIFATPVYWYAMSGSLKIFFDRLTDIVTIDKERGRRLKGKEVFLISVGADPLLPEGFEIPFRLTAEYLGMKYISYCYCMTEQLDGLQPGSVKLPGLE